MTWHLPLPGNSSLTCHIIIYSRAQELQSRIKSSSKHGHPLLYDCLHLLFLMLLSHYLCLFPVLLSFTFIGAFLLDAVPRNHLFPLSDLEWVCVLFSHCRPCVYLMISSLFQPQCELKLACSRALVLRSRHCPEGQYGIRSETR